MDSLAVVLVQALQNNDKQLLEYCFDNDVNIAKMTCLILIGWRPYWKHCKKTCTK